MEGYITRVYDNAIKVHKHTIVEQHEKYLVHHALECAWHIIQSKGHYVPLVPTVIIY